MYCKAGTKGTHDRQPVLCKETALENKKGARVRRNNDEGLVLETSSPSTWQCEEKSTPG